MSNNDEELKPCPFCGCAANGWCNGKGAPHGCLWITVKCDMCGASVTGGISKEWEKPFESVAWNKAVTKWNNRANEYKGETSHE